MQYWLGERSLQPPRPAKVPLFAERVTVWEAIALVGILALASTLRLGWAGVNSFAYDEARVSQLALAMARDGEFATVGMTSSTGIPNLPASVWIYALPYAISTDPMVATLFTGLVNVIGVACLWLLVRASWGKWEALAAATLFAASPYAVFYSRAVWSQDLLAPLAALWALLGVFAVARNSRAALAAHVFLACIAFQIHYAGACLLIPTLWLVLHYRLWRAWPALALGAVPAALAALPFALTLLRDPSGTRAAVAGILAAQSQTDLTSLRQLAEMSVGHGWEWFLLGAHWRWPQYLNVLLLTATVIVSVGLLAGIVALIRALRRKAATSAGPSMAQVLDNLLPVWALSAAVLFARHSTPAYHQYQLAAVPALWVLASGAARLLRADRRILIWVLALAAAAAQGYAMTSGLIVVAERLTPGGIGTPLSYPRAAATQMDGTVDTIVHAHDDDAACCGDVATFDVLLWDKPHRFVDGRSALLLPAGEAQILFTFQDLPAWSMANALDLDASVALYPRREGEPPYTVLVLEGDESLDLAPTARATLVNGATLTGWAWERDGDRLRAVTLWQIDQETSATFHQFHHLYTEDGNEPLAVHDVPVSSPAWRTGDRLIVWAEFDIDPSQDMWVETGMYEWPTIERSPVLNRDGPQPDPLAPIRLGPIAAP